MKAKAISNGILRAIAILTGVVLLVIFIYKVQSVIGYLAIASVISLIGRPIVRFLEHKLRFKNTIAVVATMIILLGLFMGLIGLFIPLIILQGKNLSLLNINQLQVNIENLYKEIVTYFNLYHINLEQSLNTSAWFSEIDLSHIPTFLNSFVSGLGSFSIGLFSVLFISFFFLKDSKLFENVILTFIPDDKISRWKNSSDKIKDLLSRYFVGLIVQILILFIIYTLSPICILSASV